MYPLSLTAPPPTPSTSKPYLVICCLVSTVREEQNLKTPTEDLNSKNQLKKLDNKTDTPHHVLEFPSSPLLQQLTGGDDNHPNIDVIFSRVNNENQIKAKKSFE
jgi:hypothetical protein